MSEFRKQVSKRIKIHKHAKTAENGGRSPRPKRPDMDSEREREIFKVFQTFDLDGQYF